MRLPSGTASSTPTDLAPHRTSITATFADGFSSYAGSGRGAVTTQALPEPYIGPLDPVHGEPRVVALGLNPGEADPAFQGRDGVFAREMTERSGYAAWAVTEPYLREPWRSRHRPNRYHLALRDFARRWTGDGDARSRDVLVFELYPWHSDKVTATMAPSSDLIDRYVWAPIANCDAPVVFAFGAQWQRVATDLRLPEERLDHTLSVAARRARVFRLPSGQRLAVVWQAGYNGPPGAPDVALLKAALRGSSSLPVQVPPARPARVRRPTHTAPPSADAVATGSHADFWRLLQLRMSRERPSWRVGSAKGNDLPMFSPLPGARFKFNFSRDGLRVELLLQAVTAEVNSRRLGVLRANHRDLQEKLGEQPLLRLEPLPGKIQARVAAYLPGHVGQRQRWDEFSDWFIDVLDRFDRALREVHAVRRGWG